MNIIKKTRWIICLFVLIFISCAKHCQRAFYIPDASLININDASKLKDDIENIRLHFKQKLTIRHEIDTGDNIVILISNLRSVALVRDVDTYKLISIELPIESLGTEGEILINDNSMKNIKNAVTSGGIQWIKSSCIGNIKNGSIKYKARNDSIYDFNLNLNINLTSIEDSIESYDITYKNKIQLIKGNLDNYQRVPECPCPKMYLSH
ncbi:MAG: hypothetical protein JW915_05515 [Chitinispirillaceae bacterium]|nr:hypothetical protein [Chitinispirillaceae bacterium]